MYFQSLLTEVSRAASERWPNQALNPTDSVSIRGGLTEGRDGDVVDRLAALSGRTPPSGAVLFAERDGDPVAAIGIFGGSVVADHARSDLQLQMRLHLERLLVRAVIALRGI